MSVYVDGMQARSGRMIMSHMLADTTEELLAMADAIGVDRKWIQNAGGRYEHFDVCQSKRAKAVGLGAKEISFRQVSELLRGRK